MTTPQIKPIPSLKTPSNVVQTLPAPVVSAIDIPAPVVRGARPPVVSGIRPPVVRTPDIGIDYPTIDVPTEQDFQGDMRPQQPEPTSTPDTRDLPQTPVINIGGVDVPLPEPGPLVAAGSLAVVTTVVTLGATIGVNQAKQLLEPWIKKLLQPKKKKIKIKQVKPVLHFIPNEDGTSDVIQYSQKGMKVLEGGIEKLEQHLRDQVEIDALWEYDNKIIIDEELGKQLTKEGQKRFKRYFAAPKVIAKKLGSKFAF